MKEGLWLKPDDVDNVFIAIRTYKNVYLICSVCQFSNFKLRITNIYIIYLRGQRAGTRWQPRASSGGG